MRSRLRLGAIHLLGRRPVQNIVHQCGLPAARNPRHHDEQSQWNLHVHFFEVVLGGAVNRDAPFSRRAPFRGYRNGSRARQILPRQRFLILFDLLRRPVRHHVTAQPSRARPQIDHVIGALNRLGIVFHHQHRIAQIAQALERIEQPAVVSRMQADRRFIEHVQHAPQL